MEYRLESPILVDDVNIGDTEPVDVKAFIVSDSKGYKYILSLKQVYEQIKKGNILNKEEFADRYLPSKKYITLSKYKSLADYFNEVHKEFSDSTKSIYGIADGRVKITEIEKEESYDEIKVTYALSVDNLLDKLVTISVSNTSSNKDGTPVAIFKMTEYLNICNNTIEKSTLYNKNEDAIIIRLDSNMKDDVNNLMFMLNYGIVESHSFLPTNLWLETRAIMEWLNDIDKNTWVVVSNNSINQIVVCCLNNVRNKDDLDKLGIAIHFNNSNSISVTRKTPLGHSKTVINNTSSRKCAELIRELDSILN